MQVFTKDDFNEVAESDQFTAAHRVGNKLAYLALAAPAGGIFSDANVGIVSTDNHKATFFITIPEGPFPRRGEVTFRVTIEQES